MALRTLGLCEDKSVQVKVRTGIYFEIKFQVLTSNRHAGNVVTADSAVLYVSHSAYIPDV